MVVCKFFLQGTCKFGSNCRFEHQINTDHSYTNTSSVLVQNYANKPQTTANVDTNALVKSVVNDMTAVEKGGQWLLSSYAPFKEKPAFPGFEDHSMEEVRFLFYESVKSGTVEQYKQNLQMMLQQAMIKIKALQNPSPEAISMLKTIYDTPPSSSLNNQSSINATSSSIFGGGQTQQKSVFGNPPPNQNIFGGGGGVSSQQNVYTNSILTGYQNPSNSIFGQSSTNQNQNPGNSIFTNPSTNTQSKSIFGDPQPQQATNNSIFGGGTATSIFTNPQQGVFNQQQTSPFAQTNQQSVFAPNTQQNIFQQNQFTAAQATNNPFTNPSPFTNQNTSPLAPQQNNSLFTQNPNQFVNTQAAPQNKPAFQHTQSIFGNVTTQQPNVFGNTIAQTKPNEEFYSKLEDLTEEEIKWFQSDDLDIMKIPDKPPTYEMCFKVQ